MLLSSRDLPLVLLLLLGLLLLPSLLLCCGRVMLSCCAQPLILSLKPVPEFPNGLVKMYSLQAGQADGAADRRSRTASLAASDTIP
jgi:hypothetical protein